MSSLSESQRSNARLGLWLFAAYLVLYLGFVFLSAFAAETMEKPVVAGLNLAIVYGFGLIISALVMALEKISADEITQLNIATGAPIAYTLNEAGDVISKAELIED